MGIRGHPKVLTVLLWLVHKSRFWKRLQITSSLFRHQFGHLYLQFRRHITQVRLSTNQIVNSLQIIILTVFLEWQKIHD